MKVRGDRVGAALGRGGQEAAFGAEEVQVEIGERALGQVLEGDRQLPGLRIWRDSAGQLDVGRKPLAVRKMR